MKLKGGPSGSCRIDCKVSGTKSGGTYQDGGRFDTTGGYLEPKARLQQHDFILRHMIRVEDIFVNHVIQGKAELYEAEGWQGKLGTPVGDTGGRGKQNVVAFEVKPSSGQSLEVVVANSKRALMEAWARL